MKVMYVEDDRDVQDAMVRLMVSHGLQVQSFTTAETAIEVLRGGSFTPDIILTDYQLLDRKTGVDLVLWVKNHFDIPCMMLTGSDHVEKLLKAHGINDVTVFLKGRSRPSEIVEAMRLIA